MGKWDKNKKSNERNKKIQEYLLRFSMIMYNLTPKFLIKMDYLLQKKVQRYVKIVSPVQYLTYMISLLVCSFIITISDIPFELGLTILIIIVIVMFLLRSSFDDGKRKRKSHYPYDGTDEKISPDIHLK